MAGARRPAREEKESEPGRERELRKREGGLRGAREGLQDVSSTFSGEQDVAHRQPCVGHAGAAYWKKMKQGFCRKPPRVWKIPGEK
jgi:hypothetical protein